MKVLNQVQGNSWIAYHGDSCEVMKGIPDNSIHYNIESPPFVNLYTYSNSDRDMGNCKEDSEFYEHFKFLVKEKYRTLKPGRLASFHCANIPISKEKHGYIGISDFRGEMIRIYQEAGFIYHSEVCIWKDPVVSQQRTKALGLLHKQICKDSAMSRQGIPEYLVTMRKPGTNEEPIAGAFDAYYGSDPEPLAPFTKYDDNRNGYSIEVWQRYASPVWMDINPNDTLNGEKGKRSARTEKDEAHICPLQLTVIRRALQLWTNPNDVVLSNFMGIGSEGFVSLDMGRRFVGIELKESYFNEAVKNLKVAGKDEVEQMDLLQLIA